MHSNYYSLLFLVHNELQLTTKLTEKTLTLQIRKKDEEVLAVKSQVTERDEKIRLLQEELHERNKGNI